MRSNHNEELIQYPCNFPIKIMGASHTAFLKTVADLVKAHDPSFDIATMEQRVSSKGNYLSLTAVIRATSRAQLDALYRALSSHPMVKVVL
ncbi:MAG: DUF493 family protein [Burkholderiaceae bacterium]|jgi:putative lipoic acid-binding regulatory protein|nr:DUF493 family protein [Burkholderiaceae bacterium]